MYIKIKYLINPLRPARAAWHVDKYSLTAGLCHNLPKKRSVSCHKAPSGH